MKFAVVKLGGRINANAISGVNEETVRTIQLLQNKLTNEVHYFTKILSKDVSIKDAIPHNIKGGNLEYNKNKTFDALIVINGNINFFGGAESTHDILTLHMINNWKGKIFYILYDHDLILKQYWRNINSKQNNFKYKWKNKYIKEDIEVTRDDIICVSQPYNLDAVKVLLDRTNITYGNVVHFPLYKIPLMSYKRKQIDINKYVVDLIYGGTFRGGRREKKLIKFYFNYPSNIKVELFGKIKSSQFKEKLISGLTEPIYSGMYKYYEFLDKMSTGLSTVTIGDKWYEGNNYTPRIYESVLCNTITFIDIDMDPNKKIYYVDNDKRKLNDFLHVSSREEVVDKILFLKNNINRIGSLLDEQFNRINIDIYKYKNSFINLIKNNL